MRDNSRIHRVTCAIGVVAVKECLDGARDADRAAAEREHAALTTLARACEARGWASLGPQPLALCAEQGAYAMTWAPGRSMTAAVLDAATSRDDAEALGTLAGQWLQRFHALAAAPPRAHDFDHRVTYAAGLARQVPHDRLVAGTVDALSRHAQVAARILVPESWIHGDMKADNLMVDGQSALGLDVQLVDRNTIDYDLAPFLNHLHLLELSPRGLTHRAKLARLRAGFLRGYSSDAESFALPILWLRAYLLLQAVADPPARGGLRSVVSQWRARVALRSVLRGLTAAARG